MVAARGSGLHRFLRAIASAAALAGATTLAVAGSSSGTAMEAWGAASRPASSFRPAAVSPLGGALSLWIGVYREVAGPGKGSYCPMEPSCSAYGMRAVAEHGPLLGFLATVDRLHRCGHEPAAYDTVHVGGIVKYLDPP